MKINKKDVVITTILLIISVIFIIKAPLRFGDEIFTINDKKYDDFGAKNVSYPKSFSEYEGLFDLTKFTVKEDKENYIFKYTVTNLNNKFNNTSGFSNILIDTYIGVDDSGLLTTLEYGAAITFNEDYPWLYHIRITPEEHTIKRVNDTIGRETEEYDSEIKIEDNNIILTTKKENIKDKLKDAKYYVFTGGYDILGSDNYREIGSKEDDWIFGGGIDSLYQPNILDIVSPMQTQMLSYFMPPIYASVSPVFNQIHQRLFKKELLIGLSALLFGCKYISIYRKREK